MSSNVRSDFNTSPTFVEGSIYESVVAEELIKAGFVIVSRNFKLGVDELDLIALEGDTLCIIEVKARNNVGLLEEIEVLIDDKKRQKMKALGSYFAKSHRGLGFKNLRFDFALVTIPRKAGEEPLVRYYRNAFIPSATGNF